MPEKHLSSQFDSELNSASARVMELGGLVESQLRQAIYALTQFSSEAADQVIEVTSRPATAAEIVAYPALGTVEALEDLEVTLPGFLDDSEVRR